VFQFDQQRKMEEEEKERQLKIARFQEQEKILHKILPVNIANRIINQETFIADHFTAVTVLFMDLVGFTPLSSIVPAKQLVFILDTIFSMADEVIDRYGLEKIKTIGDGYMAVGNVTKVNENHQKAAALASFELIQTMKEFSITIPSELGNTNWIKDVPEIQVRIGIHTGEVVAGVIGKNKFVFDLWGDAVNIASRMESNSQPWKIHVSNEFAKAIEKHSEFSLIPRGEISIKGKGTMNTFWLEKLK
jgi:class 3 adenylate cyclase